MQLACCSLVIPPHLLLFDGLSSAVMIVSLPLPGCLAIVPVFHIVLIEQIAVLPVLMYRCINLATPLLEMVIPSPSNATAIAGGLY